MIEAEYSGRRIGVIVQRYGIYLAFALEIVAFTVLSDRFLTYENQINVFRQISINAIIAAGMTYVILTGGIDLSVGSIVALSGVAVASVLKWEGTSVAPRIVLAILCGLAVGGLSGLLAGTVIVRFRVPPFIATLAMMTIARGLAFLYTGGRPIWGLPREFDFIGRGHFLGGLLSRIHPGLASIIPFPVVIMLAVYAVAHLVLTQSPFGRYVYAIGGNEEAARLSGIKTQRVKLTVYVLSGLAAALSGVILASRLGSGQPNSGMMFELDAIAAVVVGGTSLMGGRGSVAGTFVGALIIGELNNGLNLVGVDPYLQKVILGIVILFAVLLDHLKKEE
ncbi:MAG: ABC transporter permease [candidate division KSB1 bacterium]|nr:ABC transporter permease [candidate division KSB1 bacterium]